MNNAVFGKTVEDVRKHRNIKLLTRERRRKYLVSDPNYYTTKIFAENLLAIEMKKAKIIMNNPVYLCLSILDISKTVMYEFLYGYIKPKYSDKLMLRYMGRDNFGVYIKTDNIYKNIAENVASRFDTSDYEADRPLPMEKNERFIGLMKDELGGQIIKKVVGLRWKTYSYLKDNNDKCKKAKGTKNCIVKRKLKFEYYKKCLKASQL